MKPEELSLFNEYSERIWQIQRYHNSEIKINTTLSPDFSVPTWTITIKVNGKVFFTDYGVNLWKRLKKATIFLQKYYGDNCYKYNTPGSIEEILLWDSLSEKQKECVIVQYGKKLRLDSENTYLLIRIFNKGNPDVIISKDMSDCRIAESSRLNMESLFKIHL